MGAVRQADRVRAKASVVVPPRGLSTADVVAVAREEAQVTLSSEARSVMARSRDSVERLAAGDDPIYGVSTGFGALANVSIPAVRQRELQHALIRSHAAGMGPPVEREVVRAM